MRQMVGARGKKKHRPNGLPGASTASVEQGEESKVIKAMRRLDGASHRPSIGRTEPCRIQSTTPRRTILMTATSSTSLWRRSSPCRQLMVPREPTIARGSAASGGFPRGPLDTLVARAFCDRLEEIYEISRMIFESAPPIQKAFKPTWLR